MINTSYIHYSLIYYQFITFTLTIPIHSLLYLYPDRDLDHCHYLYLLLYLNTFLPLHLPLSFPLCSSLQFIAGPQKSLLVHEKNGNNLFFIFNPKFWFLSLMRASGSWLFYILTFCPLKLPYF